MGCLMCFTKSSSFAALRISPAGIQPAKRLKLHAAQKLRIECPKTGLRSRVLWANIRRTRRGCQEGIQDRLRFEIRLREDIAINVGDDLAHVFDHLNSYCLKAFVSRVATTFAK
jgi:hypothetical protein